MATAFCHLTLAVFCTRISSLQKLFVSEIFLEFVMHVVIIIMIATLISADKQMWCTYRLFTRVLVATD